MLDVVRFLGLYFLCLCVVMNLQCSHPFSAFLAHALSADSARFCMVLHGPVVTLSAGHTCTCWLSLQARDVTAFFMVRAILVQKEVHA